MGKAIISPTDIVADIMDRWPQTAPVFIKHQMGCVGCSMAKFESLEEALKVYHAPVDAFMTEIEELVKDEKR